MSSDKNAARGLWRHPPLSDADAATRVRVALMDEPIVALEPVSLIAVKDLIDALEKTATIMLVTCDPQPAAQCPDPVAFPDRGERIEAASTELLFTSPQPPRARHTITGWLV